MGFKRKLSSFFNRKPKRATYYDIPVTKKNHIDYRLVREVNNRFYKGKTLKPRYQPHILPIYQPVPVIRR